MRTTHEKSKNHGAGRKLQGGPGKRICDAGIEALLGHENRPGVHLWPRET